LLEELLPEEDRISSERGQAMYPNIQKLGIGTSGLKSLDDLRNSAGEGQGSGDPVEWVENDAKAWQELGVKMAVAGNEEELPQESDKMAAQPPNAAEGDGPVEGVDAADGKAEIDSAAAPTHQDSVETAAQAVIEGDEQAKDSSQEADIRACEQEFARDGDPAPEVDQEVLADALAEAITGPPETNTAEEQAADEPPVDESVDPEVLDDAIGGAVSDSKI
jgi:hypothetical protein